LQLLESIKKENIVVYPDKGEFNDWNAKVTELQKQGFKIKCSSVVENSDFETGTDLTDIYFAMKKNASINKAAIVLSDTEKKIQRLSKINPAIISLIETFDLIDEKGNGIRII
jgi:L-ribulose-5-phosphate 3-epimerase UlaE